MDMFAQSVVVCIRFTTNTMTQENSTATTARPYHTNTQLTRKGKLLRSHKPTSSPRYLLRWTNIRCLHFHQRSHTRSHPTHHSH